MAKKRGCIIANIGIRCALLLAAGLAGVYAPAQTAELGKKPFEWPKGKRVAVSLSFDDARLSQVDRGLDIFQKYGAKATFFLESRNIEKRLAGWTRAVAEGHEIANHSATHPCTGNYAFSLKNALENYTLEMMAKELDGANAEIERLLGVKSVTFAYPCGLKFVGRGREVRSYVPLVAERFLVGRGYMDEAANDPAFCDLAQAMGTPFDDMSFARMKELVEKAAQDGRWVIFVGHEIGDAAFQTTDAAALAELIQYAQDPANGVWLDTVANVGKYVQQSVSRRTAQTRREDFDSCIRDFK
ncbi:MAG: polysaccharide deacetylase family protein [Acidobacteria bacterium]|nr:polysaccharide deacetylase family protein [Acidobacteriota bacterium]